MKSSLVFMPPWNKGRVKVTFLGKSKLKGEMRVMLSVFRSKGFTIATIR